MLGYEHGEFEALKNQNAALALLASPTLLSSDGGPPARLQPELRVVFGKGALSSALQYESSVYHLGPAGCLPHPCLVRSFNSVSVHDRELLTTGLEGPLRKMSAGAREHENKQGAT